MRIIKSNTQKYNSFYTTLPSVKRIAAKNNVSIVSNSEVKYEYKENSVDSKNMMKSLFHFEQKIKDNGNISNILDLAYKFLKSFVELKDINVFFFDKDKLNLVSVDSNAGAKADVFINNALKNGIIDWVFETGQLRLVPDINDMHLGNAPLKHLLIPIKEKENNLGICSILTTLKDIDADTEEYYLLRNVVDMVISKILLIRHKEELKNTLHDLQVYQSKLSNDFKLSAVGELTFGIAEDILSSLQVILSTSDFIQRETKSDEETVEQIKDQVKKIETIITRLVKFSEVSDKKNKIQPCSINEQIVDYYNVISTSLKKDNFECILDLDEELPSVLSHPNYINQILANVFTLLKPAGVKEGGILIQTKNTIDEALVRFISTDFINIDKTNSANDGNMSLRLVDQLMKKHEGKIKINSSAKTGTTIMLFFPLKRRIR